MHVIVVHFPLAFLFVAPLFVLIGAVTGLRSMMVSALLVMVIGVAGAFVATYTGELAMGEVDFVLDEEGDAWDVAEVHEERAEKARNWFLGLTLLYIVLMVAPLVYKKCGTFLPRFAMHLIFLALWIYPTVELAHAAHEGGRLVHQYGGVAPMAETAEEEEESESDDSEDEDAEEELDQAA